MEEAMKANVSVAAFYVRCPKCGSDVSSPGGSLMWSVTEALPEKIECDNCNTPITLPAKALKWVNE